MVVALELGCAATSGGPWRGEPDFSGVARRDTGSVRVGKVLARSNFERVAVPIEDPAQIDGPELTAWK
jgi:hypothetical protein